MLYPPELRARNNLPPFLPRSPPLPLLLFAAPRLRALALWGRRGGCRSGRGVPASRPLLRCSRFWLAGVLVCRRGCSSSRFRRGSSLLFGGAPASRLGLLASRPARCAAARLPAGLCSARPLGRARGASFPLGRSYSFVPSSAVRLRARPRPALRVGFRSCAVRSTLLRCSSHAPTHVLPFFTAGGTCFTFLRGHTSVDDGGFASLV